MEFNPVKSPALPMSAVTSSPKISIVLVCWNNKDYLDPCLVSLYGSSMKHSFGVIVVDNGSTDGSQAMLKEKFPEVMLI